MNPKSYYYSEEHEWLADEGGVATVGITEFAQSELGEVVFVELPEVGVSIDAGDEIGSIESVKAASDIFAPISGEIVEINDDLESAPENINDSPYEAGWICRIRMTDTSELSHLMKVEEYEALTAQDED